MPMIDITKIEKVPIFLYVGANDTLATVEDNKWLQKHIKTVNKTYVIEGLNHVDMQNINLQKVEDGEALSDYLVNRQIFQPVKMMEKSSPEIKNCCAMDYALPIDSEGVDIVGVVILITLLIFCCFVSGMAWKFHKKYKEKE